jgi:hypothetical protein
MNWEEVGAIGQVLGSVAVFITLVYLSVQFNHARQETRRLINQGRLEGLREIIHMRLSDKTLSDLNSKAHAGLGGEPHEFVQELMNRTNLTLDECWRLHLEQMVWWQYRTQVIRYIHELGPSERVDFDTTIRRFYRADGGRQPVAALWFEYSRPLLNDPDAVRYIDNLLAQPG